MNIFELISICRNNIIGVDITLMKINSSVMRKVYSKEEALTMNIEDDFYINTLISGFEIKNKMMIIRVIEKVDE